MSIAKTDIQLQREVLDELLWDTRVKATDVGVEVDHGVVTLTGAVDSYAEKVAAQEAAHRVAGVLDVANDLHVAIPTAGQHTDADIAAAIRQALTWDVFVPEEHIRSTVTNGYVTLTGEVARLSQRQDAERAVHALQSVKGVFNEIRVHSGQPVVSAREVQAAIEAALTRRAAREARQITVRVENDVVTLAGSIPTWPEQRAVVEAATHAPGVRSVSNELRIKPALEFPAA